MITKQTWDKYEQALSSNQQDWKTREKTFQSILKGLKEDHNMTFEFVSQKASLFAIQLNDLRSGIVKLSSSCLIVFSQKYPAFHNIINYEKFTDQILKREEFVKAIGSANKVIATHATQAILAFFQNDFVNCSTLENFVQKYHNHKIAKVRERCAEVMSIFMKRIIQNQSAQRVKSDQISFFKKFGSQFCDDANGTVRKFGKSIKVELVDFGQAIQQNSFDQQYSHSQPINTSQQSKVKNQKKKVNTTKLKKQYTIPQPPQLNQMEIEDDNSIIIETKKEKEKNKNSKPYQKSNTHMAKLNSKLKKNQPQTLIQVLNNDDMSLLEKVNFLRNFNLDQYCRTVDLKEFRTILDVYENMEDPELLGWIDKIVSQIKLESFFLQLLMFLETNGRNYVKLPDTIWSNIFSQSLLLFVKYFQSQNSIESLQLLNKRFDVEEFEILARNNPQLVQESIDIIQSNVNSGQNSQSFLELNFEFLELLFQSYEIIQKYKNFKFDKEFFNKMEQFKPNLRKIFNIQSRDRSKQKQNSYQRKKLLQKSNQNLQKSSQNQQNNSKNKKFVSDNYHNNIDSGMEIEEEPQLMQKNSLTEEEENAQLVKMLEEANLQTKKSVLAQIHSHLNQLQNDDDLDQLEKKKLFNKTISILTCLSKTEQIDKQLLVQCFEVVEVLQNFLVNPDSDLDILMNTILQYFENKYYSRDISAERLLQISLRKKYLVFGIAEMNVSQDFEKVVKILKSLISLLKVGKFSDYQDQFKNEFLQVQDSVVSVMQKLFVHQQVSVRKNVVHFFVSAYYFIPSEDFEELLYPFSQEQKKLIEIYIKKSQSQQLIQTFIQMFKLCQIRKFEYRKISNQSFQKIMQKLSLDYNMSIEEVLLNIRQFPTPKSIRNNQQQVSRVKKIDRQIDKSFLIPPKFKKNRISSLEVMSFMFFQSKKKWFLKNIKESQARKQKRLQQKKLLQENLQNKSYFDKQKAQKFK